MRIAALIASTLCALALTTPSLGAQPVSPSAFQGTSWLELRTYLAGDGLVPPPSRPAASLRASETKVEIVPLPINPNGVEQPGLLSAAIGAYEKALKPLRAEIAKDMPVTGALKAKGYDIEDVLAVSRSEDGVTVFVSASA